MAAAGRNSEQTKNGDGQATRSVAPKANAKRLHPAPSLDLGFLVLPGET